MIPLTDRQLEIVMTAAAELPIEKRALLLERVAARLRLIGRFDDRDLARAVHLGLQGLCNPQFTTSREAGEIRGVNGKALGE